MTVHFIGAGPGAADLITIRGSRLIQEAKVCLYAGSLVPAELLTLCPTDARVVDTARMTLDAIIEEMISSHRAGNDVARLHSGDLSIYSAVAEQCRRLAAAQVPYSLVPGVPSFAAAAAALGQELTIPCVSQSVILTRISTVSTAMPDGEDLRTLARSRATMVIHLGARQVEQIARELTPEYGAHCPVAVVAFASRPEEVILRCRLDTLVQHVQRAGITKTAVVIIGRALTADGFTDSFLYSEARRRLDH